MTVADKIRAAINEMSQRNTRPRRVIEERLIELAEKGTVFAVDELWQEIRRAEPRLGRATVYRVVDMLVDKGLLDRIDFADSTHYYRICDGTHHHHHLTCKQCHRVVEVDICLPADQLTAIGQQFGFEIEDHSLSLFGRCPDCIA